MTEHQKKFFKLCISGNAAEIREAIRNGAEINKIDERGFMPLGLAVMFNKDAEVVEELLKAGARLRLEDRNYTELLLFTMKHPPTPEVIQLLMDYGKLTDVRGHDGTSSLMISAAENTVDVARALLKSGANVNAARCDGTTALMCAARKNSAEMVKILIDAGAWVFAKDSNKMTALHHAAMNTQNPEIIKILIEAGAQDSQILNGKTALDLARENSKLSGSPEIKMLEELNELNEFNGKKA